ncbi:hypothetical protein [Caballeronia sp. LZ035]|uniref:hypothetical protein n=1 Tax=Caballeronia sp. LZ035 TaxID=3038568 RepID=UPI0028581CA7|nr:hypothetical protein [Caballeronia sp. LZ035]MDR5755636.1 hypothetical protein [Caballeronia sp. LZ035]
METKKEKFVRLANARVTRALNDIRLIGNLSNRSHYEYSDEDVKKIVRALEDEIRTLKSRFESAPDTRATEFSLE